MLATLHLMVVSSLLGLCCILQGIWKPKRIPNPAYFEDDHPFDNMLTITAVGLELWTMSGGIFFDNFLVCSELTIANNFAREG